MSQQLHRLEISLQSTADVGLRAEINARIAAVLARLGRLQEARSKVKNLREEHGDWRSGRIHVWIMMAEAIIDWYGDLSPKALDRVTRVQVLSGAMRYLEVHAIASAWKAHIQFETSDFDGMFRSMELSYQSTSEDNGDANARLAIVACNAFSLCGDWVNAQKWFKKGRGYALAEGDLASIEALQYNKAVLAFTCLRADACIQAVDPDRAKAVRREMDSSRNLNLLTNNSVLANHLRLAEARLLLLECQFERAELSLAAVRNEAPFAAYHFSQNAIDLEIAYCQFKTGSVENALILFSKVDVNSFSELDIDDQLTAADIYSKMAELDPRFGNFSSISSRKSELAFAYSRSRSELTAGLQRFSDHQRIA
jgi:predicted negative regulator of RcsB-dependent stress response